MSLGKNLLYWFYSNEQKIFIYFYWFIAIIVRIIYFYLKLVFVILNQNCEIIETLIIFYKGSFREALYDCSNSYDDSDGIFTTKGNDWLC